MNSEDRMRSIDFRENLWRFWLWLCCLLLVLIICIIYPGPLHSTLGYVVAVVFTVLVCALFGLTPFALPVIAEFMKFRDHDPKGLLPRIMSWVQSRWLQPDGSTCQEYLIIAGVTLVLTVSCAILYSDLMGLFILFLVLGLIIASLVKHTEWNERKLSILRNVLLDMAFQECSCSPNAIITKAPEAPDLVGKPVGRGYCHVCKCRKFLEDHFPGAIEELMQERLNAFEFEDSYIPEDLAASYITPEALAYLRTRRLDRVGPERFVPLTFTVRKLRK